MKKEFINQQLFSATVKASFSRAKIYKSEVEKGDFTESLRQYLNSILSFYKSPVEEKDHLVQIQKLSDFSSSFPIFLGGRLNIGVSQKLLNLHLKYHWCLGNIPEPPHCPVDRMIQNHLKIKPIVNWTEMKTIEEYLKVINRIREKMPANYSLAKFELEKYQEI